MKLTKSGFTILEAIASVFIVSLVLTTAVSMIVFMRNQVEMTQAKKDAVDVGIVLRDQFNTQYRYIDLIQHIETEDLVVTLQNCNTLTHPISCAYFESENDLDITLTILKSTDDSLRFQVVLYEIRIVYYKNLSITLEGILYA